MWIYLWIIFPHPRRYRSRNELAAEYHIDREKHSIGIEAVATGGDPTIRWQRVRYRGLHRGTALRDGVIHLALSSAAQTERLYIHAGGAIRYVTRW